MSSLIAHAQRPRPSPPSRAAALNSVCTQLSSVSTQLDPVCARLDAMGLSEDTHGALAATIAVLESADARTLAQDVAGVQGVAELFAPWAADGIQDVGVTTAQLGRKVCPIFPLRFVSLSELAPLPSAPFSSTSTSTSTTTTTSSSSSSSAHRPGPPSSERPRTEDSAIGPVSDPASYSGRKLEAQDSGEGDGSSGVRDRREATRDGPLDALTKLATAFDPSAPVPDLMQEEISDDRVFATTPWYAHYRQALMDPSSPHMPHDPRTHPVAIVSVVTSREPDPLEAMAALHTASQSSDVFPSYMSTHVLRFYLLLHDMAHSSVPLAQSEQALEQLKTQYGLNAALVTTHSRPPTGPTVQVLSSPEEPVTTAAHPPEEVEVQTLWGERYCRALRSPFPAHTFAQGLSINDITALQSFLRSFTAQSLVPWMERSVQQWQMTLFDNRRGLTSRLWGGLNSSGSSGSSRRLWGVSRATSLSLSSAAAKTALGAAVSRVSSVKEKPASSSSSLSSPTVEPATDTSDSAGESKPESELSLPPTAGPVQMRRCGDFALILHDYAFAMTCYQHAHKDLLASGLGPTGNLYAASALANLGLARLLNEVERRAATTPLPSTRAMTALTEEEAGEALVLTRKHLNFSRFDHTSSHQALKLNYLNTSSLLLQLRAMALQYPLLHGLHFTGTAAQQLEATAGVLPPLEPFHHIQGVLYEQAALMHLLTTVPGLGPRPARRKAARDLVFSAWGYSSSTAPEEMLAVAQRNWKAAYSFEPFCRWPGAKAHVADRLMVCAQPVDQAEHIVTLLSTPDLNAADVDRYLTLLAACGDDVRQLGQTTFVQPTSLRLQPPCSTEDAHAGPVSESGSLIWPQFLSRAVAEATQDLCTRFSPEEKKTLSRYGLSERSADGGTALALGSQVTVSFILHNPWDSDVRISDLELNWDTEGLQLVSPPEHEEKTTGVALPPYGEQVVHLAYASISQGTYRPTSLSYTLHPSEGKVRVREPVHKNGQKIVRRHVWGKEDFDDLGPPEYRQDHTWDLDILAPRAQILVDVLDWPSDQHLFEGEEITARIRLTNPAHSSLATGNVYFALDQPENAILLPPGAQDALEEFREEGRERSGENSVSHPLSLYNPLFSSFTARLDPGESTEVRVKVRAQGAGPSAVHLLVLHSTDSSSRPHVGRVTLGMHVSPLVALEVTSSPARGKESEWRLLCEMRNLSPDTHVQLDALLVSSPTWSLPAPFAPRPSAGDKSDTHASGNARPALNRTLSQPMVAFQGLPFDSLGAGVAYPLPPAQVQCTLLPLAQHSASQEGEQAEKQAVDYTLHQLAHYLKEKHVDISRRPSGNIRSHVSQATLAGVLSPLSVEVSDLFSRARTGWYRRLVGQNVPSLPTRDRERIFLAVEPYSVDLAVQWHVPLEGGKTGRTEERRERRGWTFLFGLPGAPGMSLWHPLQAALQARRRALFAEADTALHAVVRELQFFRGGREQDPIQLIFSPVRAPASSSCSRFGASSISPVPFDAASGGPDVHDRDRRHLLPVKVGVYNFSPVRTCRVRLALLDGSSGVQWIGRKTFGVRLGPRAHVDLTAHALVVAEGELPPYHMEVQVEGIDQPHTTRGLPGRIVGP